MYNVNRQAFNFNQGEKMYFYSKAGFPVRVSEQFVPLTICLRETLNSFAGNEIYPVSKFHGEISWTPETPKVTVPAKPRRLICIEPRDVPSEQSSARKSSIGMTDEQVDYRLARNSSWKIVRKGKRIPEDTVAKVDGHWENVIAKASEIVSREYVRHDSHGKHGRKPAYKQFGTRRPKN
jgi:hypothetical protein